MSPFHPIVFSVFTLAALSCSYGGDAVSGCEPCFIHQRKNQKFEKKTDRFWEFREESNSWVEVELPYNLVSCVNDDCKVVNSIQESVKVTAAQRKGEGTESDRVSDKRDGVEKREDDGGRPERGGDEVLKVRKRVSLTKISEASIWVTGVSGSIYERFWNGLQWVIAPHDLPVSAGYAVSVFMANQTILALSEAGLLHQMKLTEDSHPIWVEIKPVFEQGEGTDPGSAVRLSSGEISSDRERIYFCTKNSTLVELLVSDSPRWRNHGRPPGANIAAITEADAVRPGVLFIVSGAGELYEYDQTSKPAWKKHIQGQGATEDTSLAPFKACSLKGIAGMQSVSIFVLTKGGRLLERRLYQRKWKWLHRGSPGGHYSLSSITCVSEYESLENSNSLFLTTTSGLVFEYQIHKHPGNFHDQESEGTWLNHNHPSHAKVARGIAGLKLQAGRLIFPLDDGRLAELHVSGHGGENLGPNAPVSTRRKRSQKYVWSLLDAPETEGWNAEYCTEERGPSNCILGTKDEGNELTSRRSTSVWRKDGRTQQSYLSTSGSDGVLFTNSGEEYEIPDKWVNENFGLRLMQGGISFFLITEHGFTFEYLNTESGWLWLRHEHSSAMEGALGSYNGSLFLVDAQGSLLVRERSSKDLAWINCTAMKRGRQVVGGSPWDGILGHMPRAKVEDAIFFVSKTGRLLQLTVSLRKYKWKDCRNPPSTKIAAIADHGGFRENIVFVVGRNGRLYQYNMATELWHEHQQSQHLVLSRSPGTAMRSSMTSLKGSLFMLSEEGGLVEYQWSSFDGWNWIEHGTPCTNVTLVGATGPCLGGDELLLTGSDGNAYLRYLDGGEWKWKDCGFPDDQVHEIYQVDDDAEGELGKEGEDNIGIDKDCDPKIASTRPIPFTEDSVIFKLRDGRLSEMGRIGDKNWLWSRKISTPASKCKANFWMSLAS